MFMTLATSFVVLFNCYATADILTKFLQQCFLIFIVVVMLGKSQVSVYRTIGPTLVLIFAQNIDHAYMLGGSNKYPHSMF